MKRKHLDLIIYLKKHLAIQKYDILNIVIGVVNEGIGMEDGAAVKWRNLSSQMDTRAPSPFTRKIFWKINESIPYVNLMPWKVFIEKLEELMKMGPQR